MRLKWRFLLAAWLLILTNATAYTTLWQLGEFDDSTQEFALAPDNYQAYRNPGLHMVGSGEIKKDWPYVQPGPLDVSWAPGAPQSFEVYFGLKEAPHSDCALILDFVDTHSVSPPKLQIKMNQMSWEYQTPMGAGDASVFGDPTQGREHAIQILIPPGALKAGNNVLSITILEGSWVLWDALCFEAPEGCALSPVTPQTVIQSVRAAPVLIKDQENTVQPLTVTIRHVGTPMEVQVDEKKIALKPGVQSVTLLRPAVKTPRTEIVKVSCKGQMLAEKEIQLHPVRPWEIHLVHQTHLDIGFTHTQEEVLKLQVKHLRTALRYITRTKDYPKEARFVWHPEGMWAIEEFMRIESKERKEAFIKACRKGQIHVDALYAQAMTGMYTEEELFELLGAAKRFERKYNVPVVSAMQSDVPGYTWGLAAALAHHGVPYLSVGPNWFASGGPNDYFMEDKIRGNTHRGGRVFHWADQPFWWMDPSGKHKIFFWMPGWGYSGFHGNRGAISREKVYAYLHHLEKTEYPYDMVYWRYGIGADNGPPSREMPDIVKAWNETHVSPKMIINKNSQVMKTFVERYGEKLPVLKGDYSPYWEDGCASTAKATRANRRAAEKLAQVQTLWSMLNPDLKLHHKAALAWNKLIMYDEHTWGSYCSISQPDSPFSIQQDKYKQAYAFDGAKMADELINEVVPERDSNVIDVYNTASWARDGLILLSMEGDLVKDDSGTPIPSQRLGTGELAFVAKDVPPLGMRRFSVHPGKAMAEGSAKAHGTELSNESLVLQVDEQTGAIKSLRFQGISKDLVQKDSGLNDYLFIQGRDAEKNRYKVHGPVKITVEDKGPLVAALRVESDAPRCKKLIRRIRVVHGLDWVELINTADKIKERRPEGVYFGFPFNIQDPGLRIDAPWSVVEVEKDQLPGANRNFYCVQRWVDISNKEYGVTWVTRDAPMLQLEPIKIAQPFGKEHWREHVDPVSHIHSWVMNNHWECNYKADQEGEITFCYAISPHVGAYDPIKAQRFGRHICQPLLALPGDASQKTSSSLLEISTPGVVVTTIRPSWDSKALMVRLFNVAKEKQIAQLKWNRPISNCWLSNPMEDVKDKAPSQIEMTPFEIVTLRVEH